VQAFFVLSGFLLTPILVNMRYQLPAGKYFLHFTGRAPVHRALCDDRSARHKSRATRTDSCCCSMSSFGGS
jgi:hypothetical protein